LPLLFYKRLCDVFEDELLRLKTELGLLDVGFAREFAAADRSLTRFYIPAGAAWGEVRKSSAALGERLTDAMIAIGKENPRLQGVIDRRDFNATEGNQRIVEDETLARLMESLNRQRLGLNDVEPDLLGRAYEYLLRKFAEGGGQSAGEFFTPREVGLLMAHILDPEEGDTIFDPACGSGGLLIKAQLRLKEKAAAAKGVAPGALKPGDIARPLQLFGQEINADTYAMAQMNAFLHDMEAEVRRGDTMLNPRFLDEGGALMTFDKVTANPMWNQKFGTAVYDNDTFDRFGYGAPPGSSADWGWIQHMLAQTTDPSSGSGQGGKLAVVLDTGAVSRGSGNQGSNKERDARQAAVEADLVEAVVLLPENLFYNTSAPGIILVLNRAKAHPNEILLINASRLFAKGKPKNYLTETHIERVFTLYAGWQAEEKLSAVVTTEEVTRNDYNLSPSRYVATDEQEPALPLEEALVLLAEAEEARGEADRELDVVLGELGFGEWRNGIN
jgi:type I restriction enzyme M protein